MKKRLRDTLIVICLVVYVGCFFGCSSGEKGDRGFVPVSRAEAEAFAKPLIAKFNQGDKTPFYDFATGLDASLALTYYARLNTPGSKKKSREHTAEDRKIFAETTMAVNKNFFDMVSQVEIAEIKEEYGTFCVVLDCKIKQRSNPLKTDLKLLKKKSTDEIVVASRM